MGGTRRPAVNRGALEALLAVLRDGQRHEGRELLSRANCSGVQAAARALAVLVAVGAVRQFGGGMRGTYRLAIQPEEVAMLVAPRSGPAAPVPGRLLSPTQVQSANRLAMTVRWAEDGLTHRAIAERLGVTHQAVSARLARHRRNHVGPAPAALADAARSRPGTRSSP